MWTVLYRVLEPGANLHPLECLLVYLAPLWFLALEGALGEQLLTLATWNFLCQLSLFVVFVHVPALLTGHMSYGDRHLALTWLIALLSLGPSDASLGSSHSLAAHLTPHLAHFAVTQLHFTLSQPISLSLGSLHPPTQPV